MKRRTILLAALAAAWAGPALAQAYPNRPVTLVLPFPPGGSVDVIGRIVATRLGAALGQPVVVQNRPGAGGVIGATAVATAPKDGYTLLLSSSSTHSLAPALRATMPYDPLKDFAPIIEVANGRSVLLIPDSLPVKDVQGLLAYMKARGSDNNFGSAGLGTLAHLRGELFKQATGVQMTHIPYKGTSLGGQDLSAGRLTMMFDSDVSAKALLRTGKVRALAVNGPSRSPMMPDVPTLSEAGVQAPDPQGYFGLWAPAGTPAEIVELLARTMDKVLQSPEMKADLASASAEAVGGTSVAFANRIARDIDMWMQAAKIAGIKPE